MPARTRKASKATKASAPPSPQQVYWNKAGTYEPAFRRRQFDAYRSKEDGVWRVWAKLKPEDLGLSGYPKEQRLSVIVGAHEKLVEAVAMANKATGRD